MSNIEQKIIDVSYDLVKAKPLSRIKTIDIINAANTCKGTFYRYFKDKYDAIARLCKDRYFIMFDPSKNDFSKAIELHTQLIVDEYSIVSNIAKNDSFTLVLLDVYHAYVEALKKYFPIEDRGTISLLSYQNSIKSYARTLSTSIFFFGFGKISATDFLSLNNDVKSIIPHALYRYIV